MLEMFITDPLDAAGNTTKLQFAMLVSVDGVRINYGGETPARFRAISGGVCPVGINKTLAGIELVPGLTPRTKVAITEGDGAGANFVYCASAGQATGIVVRDLQIDGGRSLGIWGSQTGACISISGQNDYGATQHGVQIINCWLFDGLTQQTALNSVNGFTFNRLKTWATTSPTVASHGGDFDAVGDDKPTKNGTIRYCDLDAYGQECMKFENSTDILIEYNTIRMYVTLTQDNADCYSELGRITFRGNTIDAAICLTYLKRRHVPGQPTNVRKTTDALTVSGAGTVGGTITGTSSPTAFTGGDVGKSVGSYSGFGTGFGVIESVTTGTATIRVHDIFANNDASPLVYEANEWVLGYMDTGGDGTVTFERNTFTINGLIWPQDGNSANYGTQTITDNWFDPNGNSYKYPAGVTPTASGNAFAGLAQKRFVRPSTLAKYGSLGGTGIVGLNEGAARANPQTTNINTAIGWAVAGEEVVAVDGWYVAAAGGANRSINLGGKAITVRAENAFGAWIDLTGGSGWNGLSSSADVAGSLMWGFVFYGAGQGGGNGSNINVSGTSAITLRKVAALNGKTANNGANFRGTSTGAWVMEDYWLEGGDGGATTAGLYVSAVPSGSAPTLRRGVVRGNTTSGAGIAAGVRLDCAGIAVEGLEVSGNTGTGATSIAGMVVSKNATITNLTAAGNASGASAQCNDVQIGASVTITGDSWICRSTSNGLKPIANQVTASVLTLDKSNLVGWDGTNASVCSGTPASLTLTNISANDPQFVDATGGNYQLKSTSPARAAGVARERWDYLGTPYFSADQGAWAYAA